MRVASGMLALLFTAATVQAMAQPDPYGSVPTTVADQLAYAAERGGEPEALAIERWLSRHSDAPPRERAMLAHRLCLNYGVLVGGERRVAACTLSVALSGDAEDKSDLAIAEAFRREPPIEASGGTTIPLTRSSLGLLTVAVVANTTTSAWLVDTGAEITTIPESTATLMGVRMVKGTADVGTSTNIRVRGRLGVIDKLAIGTATVEHVPVLVLPDAMLRLHDNQVIPGILGLPVLAAFRRVSWLDGGSRLSLGKGVSEVRAKAAASAWRVYWHEDGLGVPLTTTLGTRGAHLDTGATSSQLSPLGLMLLTPAQAAKATVRRTRMGGAGGMVEGTARILPALDYTLAGTPIHAEKLTINDSPNGAGTVGSDALAQLDAFTIDFDTMTVTTIARRR